MYARRARKLNLKIGVRGIRQEFPKGFESGCKFPAVRSASGNLNHLVASLSRLEFSKLCLNSDGGRQEVDKEKRSDTKEN
jgi:hypothetical protein